MAELLLELFSEEIPARMQARAAEDLQRLVCEKLKAAGLVYTSARACVTPRRLALVVDGMPAHSADERKEEKGPKVGAPQPAIDGFLKKYGLASLAQCEQRDTGKGVFYVAVIEKKGGPTAAIVAGMIESVLMDFAWPKSMKWASNDFRWVRPLHSIVAVLDGKPVPTTDFELGVTGNAARGRIPIGATTFGHRFLAPGAITVTGFADYQAKLRAAFVILDPAERRALIAEASEAAAAKLGLAVKPDPALLDEVTGLVEWPVVLSGRIDAEFMAVPAEVLTTTMRVNQKYFALTDAAGRLAPHFLLVANLAAKDGGAAIVAGNERVLRARLSDAKFFWEQDQKLRLADRLPALDGITYHARLGSVGAKVQRIRALAAMLSAKIAGGDAGLADKAAQLAKADLVSGMVGEFPELQGVMGRYYARLEGLPEAVADAIADHYKPLGPNDACPTAPVSVAVALADKLDSLVGFFAIDERPTGSKDPFALRRAALGVIRLILENRLRLQLRDVLAFAYGGYDGQGGGFAPNQSKAVIALLMDFFADRLKVALKEQGIRHDLVAAVFALGDEDDLARLLARVEALKGFVESADGTNLLAAYKRANNIVRIEEKKDNAVYGGGVDAAALAQDEEKALFAAIERAQAQSKAALADEAYGALMGSLAALRRPVDAFFEKVTVNAEEPKLRANRLRMLAAINATLSAVADFSKIEG